MSTLRIFAKAAAGQFDEAMGEAVQRVRVGAMAAAHEAAQIGKAMGRADIAAAGFGQKWQNTFRSEVYPQRAMSTRPTVHFYHQIAYSGIFESGGAIAGSPLLWLPLPSTPKRVGRNRMTPETFVDQIGPLFPIAGKGGRPLLAANVSTDRRGQRERDKPPVTLSALRRGAGGGAGTVAVPMFFGISSVTLRDRFSIREIVEKIAAEMPSLFARQFDSDG